MKTGHVCDCCDPVMCDLTKVVSAGVGMLSTLSLMQLASGPVPWLRIPLPQAALVFGGVGMLAVTMLLLVSIKHRLRRAFPFL